MAAIVPGGKGLNVARTAAALGVPVTALAVLSGHAGRWISDALAASGVRGRYVWASGETRSCLSIYERSTRQLTEFYEEAGALSVASWDHLATHLADELGVGAALVTMSGSLPRGVPIDGYARFCDMAAAAHARIAIDTHGEALRVALPARPWLVKVNRHEAGEATGLLVRDERSALESAEAMVAAGAQNALVTLGVHGAVFVGVDDRIRLHGVSTVGPYPVGSGDAFLAGLAAAYLRGGTILESVRYGGAVATANALHPGAGEVLIADVDRLLEGTLAERIA